MSLYTTGDFHNILIGGGYGRVLLRNRRRRSVILHKSFCRQVY